MIKKRIIHYGKLVVQILLREWFIKYWPKSWQRALAQRGFSQWVSRSGIQYLGRVYGSDFWVDANSKYAVERNATMRNFEGDPIGGIRLLEMRDWVMMDIGANIGAYSLGAVAAGARKVFAVEPGPFFSRLEANIRRNTLGEVIVPIRIGLACERGTMFWHEDENNPGNAHLLKSLDSIDVSKISTKLSAQRVEVPVLPLDELVSQLGIGHVDFIKIDVEGMEWEVIQSGQALIRRSQPIVLVETHRVAPDMMRYDCLTPLFYFFYDLGYKSYSLIEGQLVEFIYPNFSLDTFFIKDGRNINKSALVKAMHKSGDGR